ncbi:hypothetical protein [Streptomyces mexicanus]|uniref:Uncharacterized protein n=1 Tax=Streptomyces mexicanus TaxID=178566 RepID=A0A7X1HWK0_9ACTN|nr:hypothetical protein [Streptomyces mexicanus]MBC2864495.1 hypothetical protein [Streptomyces mexicanus]
MGAPSPTPAAPRATAAKALFGTLLVSAGGGFSLPGMRLGLLAVAAVLVVTAALTRFLLRRD